jgi:HlyD family secretion protein
VNARRIALLVLFVLAVAAGVHYARGSDSGDLVLTGIVTTEDVIVSPQVSGRIDTLAVDAGDSVVEGQLVATIAPAELEADQAYFVHTAEALEAQVKASEADVAAAEAQVSEAVASLAKAKQTFERTQAVANSGGLTPEALDQARTAVDVAQARADAAQKHVIAARSALGAARQQRDAAAAQAEKAGVRLAYTDVRAPISGIVDVRAVRQGEVVNTGEPIVTLVDPDDLWVRADVEESYIDRIRLGDTLTVRLPSGRERSGKVFYRGVDADYATQRDVSRTKRDIKTFEVRLRVDNRDRRLALGMTAYILLPVQPSTGKAGS